MSAKLECLRCLPPSWDLRGPVDGLCNDIGPWGTRCSQERNHRWSHYDASDDSSWQDGWREEQCDPEDGYVHSRDGWDGHDGA